MTASCECTRCYRDNMRPMHTLLEDHPGTVGQALPGLCTPCYKISRKHSPKIAKDDAKVRGDRLTLASYLNWRRPYRVEAGTE